MSLNLKDVKIMLKNKQAKNLSIFIPKKTIKIIDENNKNQQKIKYKKIKTNLTAKQLRYIKRFKNCYFTKELSHKHLEKRKAKRKKIINISSFIFNIAIFVVVLLLSFAGQEDKSQVVLPFAVG